MALRLAMDEMHKQFSEAYNRGDLDMIAATFSENAVAWRTAASFRGGTPYAGVSATPSYSGCMTIRFKEPSRVPKAAEAGDRLESLTALFDEVRPGQ